MVQMRKVLRELYPEEFGNGRKVAAKPPKKRGFLWRFLDRRIQRVGLRFQPIKDKRKRLFQAAIVASMILLLWGHMYYYNKFVMLSADVSAARSQVEVQLQRRKEVSASLNTVVMAYAKHEKTIFEHAVDTRKEIIRPAPAEAAAGEPAKEGPKAAPRLLIPGLIADPALSKLLAVAEGFPALRLSENFQRLMDALVESETKVAEQRMQLNTRCNDLATAVHTFPGRVFNLTLRFKVPEFYSADTDVHDAVKLDLILSAGLARNPSRSFLPR